MQDLEPPEVPIETPVETVEKKGFLQKLFSKKIKDEPPLMMNPMAPPLETIDTKIPDAMHDDAITNDELRPFEQDSSSIELPNLEETGLMELPPLEMPAGQIQDNLAKGKKQQKSKKSSKASAKKEFDWTQSLEPDNIDNLDIDSLIGQAKMHIEEQKEILKKDESTNNAPVVEGRSLLPDSHVELNDMLNQTVEKYEEEKSAEKSKNAIVPEMPEVHPDDKKAFDMLDKTHERLRTKLSKKISSSGFATKKKEFVELLKEYDEKIEKRIEQKQQELGSKRLKLENFHKTLVNKEKEIKRLHGHFKEIDDQLKAKEEKINQIIASEVRKQTRRGNLQEKGQLRKELADTQALTSKLEQQIVLITKDREEFNKKKNKLLAEENTKLIASQQLYEKKLAELDIERKLFEDRRAKAMTLLQKGETIGQEMQKLKQMKDFVLTNKRRLTRELNEDRHLKKAIDAAENRVNEERKELDEAIFQRYLETHLGTLPQGFIDKATRPKDLKISFQTGKIYGLIRDCKEQLLQGKINEAKKVYNIIKRTYETTSFTRTEKIMLFNSLRALYNEIELTALDVIKRQQIQ